MAENEKTEQKPETINFALGPKQAIWEGKRGDGTSLRLSRFTGQVYGKVEPSDKYLYAVVQNAIMTGELLDTKKDAAGKIADKEEVIDLTNMAENKNASKVKARQILKTVAVEDLEKQIPTYRDPNLIVAMIELESRGMNRSKRRRDAIVTLLKNRLETVTKELKSKGVMFAYSEQTGEGVKVNPADGSVAAGSDSF